MLARVKTRLERARLAALAAAANGGKPLIDMVNASFHKLGFFPDQELLSRRAAEYFAHRPYEPDPLGSPAARAAIAEYYATRGLAIKPQHILLTAGTGDSLQVLLRQCADPGDRILIPSPGYPIFEQIARDCGLDCDFYPLEPADNWQPDLDVLESLIQPDTRFLLIISPNNPTGAVYSPQLLTQLGHICERWNIAIIHDEVFSEYLLPVSTRLPRFGALGMPGEAGAPGVAGVPVYILNGVSKLCASPDLKLGWIAMQGVPHKTRRRMEHAYDAFLNVAALSQFLLPDLLASVLEPGGLVERVNKQLVANDAQLARVYPQALPLRRGGIHRVLLVPGLAADADQDFAIRLLERYGVYVHPASLYGFDDAGAVVLSLLAGSEFSQALGSILTLAAE